MKHKEVRPGWGGGKTFEESFCRTAVVITSSIVRQFRMITNRTAIVPRFAVKERKIEIETQQKMRTVNQEEIFLISGIMTFASQFLANF